MSEPEISLYMHFKHPYSAQPSITFYLPNIKYSSRVKLIPLPDSLKLRHCEVLREQEEHLSTDVI